MSPQEVMSVLFDYMTPRYRQFLSFNRMINHDEIVEIHALCSSIDCKRTSMMLAFILVPLTKYHLASSGQMLTLKKTILKNIDGINTMTTSAICESVKQMIDDSASAALKQVSKKKTEIKKLRLDYESRISKLDSKIVEIVNSTQNLDVNSIEETTILKNQNISLTQSNLGLIKSYDEFAREIQVKSIELDNLKENILSRDAQILIYETEISGLIEESDQLKYNLKEFKNMVLCSEIVGQTLSDESKEQISSIKRKNMIIKQKNSQLKSILAEKNAIIDELVEESLTLDDLINKSRVFLKKQEKKHQSMTILKSNLERFKSLENPKSIFGFSVTPNFLKEFRKITNNILSEEDILKIESFSKSSESTKIVNMIILDLIAKMCKNFGGKANIWFRHFLVSKYFTKENEIVFKKNLCAKFYYTYINPTNSDEIVNLETYTSLTTIERRNIFAKNHKQFDSEIHTRTSLYTTDTPYVQRQMAILKGLIKTENKLKEIPKLDSEFLIEEKEVLYQHNSSDLNLEIY